MTLNRAETIVPQFLEAVAKFGYEDFFSQESSNKPHRLQTTAGAENRYFHRLFHAANRVLEKAYEDSQEYIVHYSERRKLYTCRKLFPEVEKEIAAHGKETREAFKVLFAACKSYYLALDRKGNEVAQETHGLSEKDARTLDICLQKIWAAYPETDPRILEGYEYVTTIAPILKTCFPNYNFGGSHRSDAKIAEWLENAGDLTDVYDSPIEPQTASDIAAQTAFNLMALKDFSAGIAEKVLALYLKKTLKVDSLNWSSFAESGKIAKQILASLKAGMPVKNAAQLIGGQHYAPLQGENLFGSGSKETHQYLQHAEEYLAFCQTVHSGEWFEKTSVQVSNFAKMQYLKARHNNAPIP